MTILISIPCLNQGGTEMQTLQLATSLIGAGHFVEVLCYFEHEKQIVDQFEQAGCTVNLLKWPRSKSTVSIVFDLRKLFKSNRPDVVHVQYMSPGALPILAARLAGVRKVLATVHQPCTASHGIKAKVLLRVSAFMCTRFISISKNAEQSWFGSSQLFDQNLSLKAQPKHFTIYNSVDVEKIQNIQNNTDHKALKVSLNIPSDKLVIGCVSRLRHEKGIDVLVESFAEINKQNRHVHLLIVGTGPDENKLKTRIQELDLVEQATFFGEASWETAMKCMSIMDIVVVPSRFEGFGLSAAEAMALAKPIVAAKVDGLKEVLTENETGYFFESESYSELSVQIGKLIHSETLRVKMGNSGFHKVQKYFNTPSMKETYEALYKWV